MLDWPQLDKAIHATVLSWRTACHDLLHASPKHKEPPVPSVVCALETLQTLHEHSDAFAQALAQWVAVLHCEAAVWPNRVQLAQRWVSAQPGGPARQPQTLTVLRDKLLSLSQTEERQAYAQSFVSHAPMLAVPALAMHRKRAERYAALKSRFGHHWGAPQSHDLAVQLARTMLKRSDDLAHASGHENWLSGLRASLGVEAAEGWPARLTARWVKSVFAGTGIDHELRMPKLRLPRAWGASSFARALAMFGTALLDASRKPSSPFVLHQTPFGTRRHQRRSLFARLVVEPSFGHRILGLSKQRAREQQRAVAQALAAHIRIDALRVLSMDAWRSSPENIHEAFSKLAQRALGPGAPTSLFAVLPQLRPDDGPRLLGQVLAHHQRTELIERFDEDWFINPQAIAHLRTIDSEADLSPAPSMQWLHKAQEKLFSALEAAIA